MNASIIAAIISGVLTLFGTIITIIATNSKTTKQMEINQAVTNQRLDDLTREVRAHNNFAQRVPVLEEKMKVTEHRLSDLEKEQRK